MTVAWIFLVTWLVNGYFDNVHQTGIQMACIIGFVTASLGLIAIWVFLYRLNQANQPQEKVHEFDNNDYKSSIIKD